ncbi:hypothetical protein OAF56_04410 [Pirellulaceae bacterium]|jgi:hypothetical protein|nr:hypothetical protein [Pirellulaceae bacterium]
MASECWDWVGHTSELHQSFVGTGPENRFEINGFALIVRRGLPDLSLGKIVLKKRFPTLSCARLVNPVRAIKQSESRAIDLVFNLRI